jgi:hypothetical protein
MWEGRDMAAASIKCPQCGADVDITEALKRETEAQSSRLVEQAREQERARLVPQLQLLHTKLQGFQEKEQTLQARERDLAEKEANIQAEVSRKLADIEASLKDDLSRKAAQDTKLAVEQAVKEAQEQERARAKSQTDQLQSQLREQTSKLQQLLQQEQLLQLRERELGEKEANIQAEIARKLSELEISLRDELARKATQDAQLAVADLKNQLQETTNRLSAAAEAELEHRRLIRTLQDQQRDFDLALARKLDEERSQLEAALRQRYSEESGLKLREKEQQIEGLRRSLEEAHRKSEQGSMELQGEALEVEMEEKLRRAFVRDIFEPVLKGVRGGDVVHTVRNSALEPCGTILWEAKNAKNWGAGWIQKLKDDQREACAGVAVLVTVAAPKEISNFGMLDGILVCTPACLIPLAALLRERVQEVAYARGASNSKRDKTEVIFDYISGDDFKGQVEAIIEAFAGLRTQIDRERRAMEKQWKEREKLCERIMLNTSRMYGDIRGIAGASIKEIPSLELASDPVMLEESQPLDPSGLDDVQTSGR